MDARSFEKSASDEALAPLLDCGQGLDHGGDRSARYCQAEHSELDHFLPSHSWSPLHGGRLYVLFGSTPEQVKRIPGWFYVWFGRTSPFLAREAWHPSGMALKLSSK